MPPAVLRPWRPTPTAGFGHHANGEIRPRLCENSVSKRNCRISLLNDPESRPPTQTAETKIGFAARLCLSFQAAPSFHTASTLSRHSTRSGCGFLKWTRPYRERQKEQSHRRQRDERGHHRAPRVCLQRSNKRRHDDRREGPNERLAGDRACGHQRREASDTEGGHRCDSRHADHYQSTPTEAQEQPEAEEWNEGRREDPQHDVEARCHASRAPQWTSAFQPKRTGRRGAVLFRTRRQVPDSTPMAAFHPSRKFGRSGYRTARLLRVHGLVGLVGRQPPAIDFAQMIRGLWGPLPGPPAAPATPPGGDALGGASEPWPVEHRPAYPSNFGLWGPLFGSHPQGLTAQLSCLPQGGYGEIGGHF
jgi:hypothetical protein